MALAFESGERPESPEIEEKLWKKVEFALKELREFREPTVDDVFTVKRYYLGPEDFKVTNYIRSRPFSAFNPGVLLRGDRILLFPRLVFEFYLYSSSVGLCEIKMEDVISGEIKKPLETKIILWPKYPWEQMGCEDPRVFESGNKVYILYCGKGVYRTADGKSVNNDALALAVMDENWNVERRGYFYVKMGDLKHVPSNRDSAIIKMQGYSANIVTRPVIRKVKVCWRAKINVNDFSMPEDELKPVFAPEHWESHVGWSTNCVKLSRNEYLVGWHGVSSTDLTYRNGLAIVDENGDLLAISNYTLSPKGLIEEYGDRPFTMFGNGLIVYKEYLIWVGGIGDCCIGIFIAELEKALEKMKDVKRHLS
ncbi:MAG: glycosidase [Candidatus Baldrarchaeia archaeon]